MHHMSNTLHVLCIATNARYGEDSPQPDMDDFFKTLNIINSKTPQVSPLDRSLISYLNDYICGMYPEFKGPLSYFQSLVDPTQCKGKQLTQEAIKECFDKTMARYPNLKPHYDFEQDPSPQQLTRLIKTVGARQKQDMEQYAPKALAQLGIALLDESHDIRLVHQFMKQFSTIRRIVSGEIDRKDAQENTGISGVIFGLKMAEMKDQGILDDKLNILDNDRFYKSDVVTHFSIDHKEFNLAANKQPSFIRRLFNRVRDFPLH